MYQRKAKFKALKPLEKQPTTHPLAAFDVEGVGGRDGFISAGVMTDDSYELFSTPRAMIDYLHTRPFKGYRIAAHNLTYDYGVIEHHLWRDDEALLINGRPFKVTLPSGKRNPRYLIDSLLFSAGLPLSKLGEALNIPKLETPPELKKLSALTPQTQRESLFKRTDIRQYLERDVEIVLRYMQMFQTLINDLGGEMRFTLASTAMDLFRRAFLRETYYTPFDNRQDYARKAYYGGRVEPIVRGVFNNVNVYDINSLYPYVMLRHAYPNTNFLIGPCDDTHERIIHEYEGVSEVEINIPDMYIPPLPYRRNGKLYFPTGTYRGYWTHVELRRACKMGCTIKHVHTSLYTTEVCYPFAGFVTALYDLRQKLKRLNDPRELVVKILLNSLYGKFGQRSDAGLQQIKDIGWWLQQNPRPSVDIREIDGIESVLLPVKSWGTPSYVNTLWAAHVTSYARLTLLDYMLEAGPDCLYSDTDSIFTFNTLETSNELGGMKLENYQVTAEIIGPKAYLILKDDTVIKAKCKGVPANQRLDFLISGVAKFERPIGVLEAAHRRPKEDGTAYYPSEWVTIVKREAQADPKRVFAPPEAGHLEQSRSVPHSNQTLPPEPHSQGD